jgi:hypothetical protein
LIVINKYFFFKLGLDFSQLKSFENYIKWWDKYGLTQNSRRFNSIV